MVKTLHLPKARVGYAREKINAPPLGEPGPFRILLKPESRRDLRQYYAVNSSGMFWTQMREVAKEFTHFNLAQNIVRRVTASNGKLRDRIVVVPV